MSTYQLDKDGKPIFGASLNMQPVFENGKQVYYEGKTKGGEIIRVSNDGEPMRVEVV